MATNSTEKDWEDIRKMPEHGTLQRDFGRLRSKLVERLSCAPGSESLLLCSISLAIRAVVYSATWRNMV